MLFNSYGFILAFLPITLAIYFLIGRAKAGRLGIAVLAIASILFIAFSNIQSAVVLTISVWVDYVLNCQLCSKHGKAKKAWLIIALIINIGINTLIFCLKVSMRFSGQKFH